ncbi:MAG: CarD family transcriptional regulator [Ruminococcus sp.]|nr:CarD family transcriptional regulator [Ruminococcus sp.]
MFNVGDAVVYATYGVCVIKSIETRDLIGEDVEYYVLQPAGDPRNTFYVPTSNGSLRDKMRRVMSKEETESLICSMPREELIWIEDEQERKTEYRRILDGGDRRELVGLIKTLYLHKQQLQESHKKLHSADERALNDAENMLYDEFAYSLGISREQVLPYIREHV